MVADVEGRAAEVLDAAGLEAGVELTVVESGRTAEELDAVGHEEVVVLEVVVLAEGRAAEELDAAGLVVEVVVERKGCIVDDTLGAEAARPSSKRRPSSRR